MPSAIQWIGNQPRARLWGEPRSVGCHRVAPGTNPFAVSSIGDPDFENVVPLGPGRPASGGLQGDLRSPGGQLRGELWADPVGRGAVPRLGPLVRHPVPRRPLELFPARARLVCGSLVNAAPFRSAGRCIRDSMAPPPRLPAALRERPPTRERCGLALRGAIRRGPRRVQRRYGATLFAIVRSSSSVSGSLVRKASHPSRGERASGTGPSVP